MDKNSPYYAFGLYGSLGLQIGVAIGLGAYGGQWLDEKFATGPWLMVVGVLLGCVAGLMNIIKMLKIQSDELKEQENVRDDNTKSQS